MSIGGHSTCWFLQLFLQCFKVFIAQNFCFHSHIFLCILCYVMFCFIRSLRKKLSPWFHSFCVCHLCIEGYWSLCFDFVSSYFLEYLSSLGVLLDPNGSVRVRRQGDNNTDPGNLQTHLFLTVGRSLYTLLSTSRLCQGQAGWHRHWTWSATAPVAKPSDKLQVGSWGSTLCACLGNWFQPIFSALWAGLTA